MISKDEELELYLKRQPNFCFLNIYFDFGFNVWQISIDIQPILNEYKAVTYLCQYFSKTEDQCSQVMKKVDKEAFDNNMDHNGIMKSIAKAYSSN